MADASTLFNVVPRLGGSLGIAALGGLYAAGVTAARQLHPRPAALAHLTAAAAQAWVAQRPAVSTTLSGRSSAWPP